MTRGAWRVALAAAMAVVFGDWALANAALADPVPADDDKIAAAIDLIKLLDRPGQINLATIWDGNKYVQCRASQANSIRCEAAGTLMQPSLGHVLTAERSGRLLARGWALDSSFGNYTRTFAASTPTKVIAQEIVATLSQVYDADVKNLEIETTSVADEPCPRRNGPTQNLAGMISNSDAMKRFTLHACSYTADDDQPAYKLGPEATATQLIAAYGPKVTLEIQRLRLNIRRRVFVIVDTGLGYLQCGSESEPKAFYCEAQSADSWPALAAVLTPEHVARLHAAGYADPGRAPNYSKTYLLDDTTDANLAAEILTLLHDVYGYRGASKLEVKTEEH